MKANIIRIGNSKGICLPKAVLEHCHLENTVELKVEEDQLVIRSLHTPRTGWDESFAILAERGDDTLLDLGTQAVTEWEQAEWKW